MVAYNDRAELEEKVHFLLQPASYPDPTATVRGIETHTS